MAPTPKGSAVIRGSRRDREAAKQTMLAGLQAEVDAEAQQHEEAEGQDHSGDSEGSEEDSKDKESPEDDEEMGDADKDSKAAAVEDALLSPTIAADTIRKLLDRVEHLESDLASSAVDRITLRETGQKPRYEFRKPPMFSGEKNQDIREWLKTMETYCDGTGCSSEAIKLPLMASYLDGRARTYWASRQSDFVCPPPGTGSKGVPVTVKLFQDTMIQGFGNIDPIQSAWDKLVKLRQGGSSVEEYARQFDALCADLGSEGPSENDKIIRFKGGLHPKMQTRCVAQNDGKRWTNYRDLVAYASAVWAQVGATLEASGPGTVVDKPGKQPNHKRKHESGANGGSGGNAKGGASGARPGFVSKRTKRATKKIASRRVLSETDRQRLIKEGKCLNCEQTGHFARECKNPAKGSTASGSQGN